MSDLPNAMIRVFKVEDAGQVASVVPERLSDRDLDQISEITNRVVANLQAKIPTETGTGSTRVRLSEIELEFGIDFGVEAEGEVKIAIIGPKIRGGVHGGATFSVRITLSRS